MGDALETERHRRQLSQEEAGRELGRSQSAFYRYISGGPVPLTLARPVARFLDLPIEEVRTMILESHDQPEDYRMVRKPSVADRLDVLEQSIAALTTEVAALVGTPRRAGKRVPDGQSHGAR